MSLKNQEIQFYDYHPEPDDFFGEVLDGLKSETKSISPKFFYDENGSKIFEKITELPEYYITRIEKKILEENVCEISGLIDEGCLLAEPGSGNSEKVRILLDTIKPSIYVPMEISKTHLRKSAEKLSEDYPWLDVHATCVDFTKADSLPCSPENLQKVAFFPGSTIGNFEPDEAVRILENIAQMIGPGGGLLIGVDLKKNRHTLHAAYSDSDGVTAEFNYNLLKRINRELGADFDIEEFSHKAVYNEKHGRMESHLVSQTDQTVNIDSHSFEFNEGESIHTENSYKFTIEQFRDIAQQAGFVSEKVWTDDDELFSVHYMMVTGQ